MTNTKPFYAIINDQSMGYFKSAAASVQEMIQIVSAIEEDASCICEYSCSCYQRDVSSVESAIYFARYYYMSIYAVSKEVYDAFMACQQSPAEDHDDMMSEEETAAFCAMVNTHNFEPMHEDNIEDYV